MDYFLQDTVILSTSGSSGCLLFPQSIFRNTTKVFAIPHNMRLSYVNRMTHSHVTHYSQKHQGHDVKLLRLLHSELVIILVSLQL